MFYIVSNTTVVFRSTNKAKLYAKFLEMKAKAFHSNTLEFTDIKPVVPKQRLNVAILSY